MLRMGDGGGLHGEPAVTLDEKHTRLKDAIAKLGSVVVAYSGGIDSALVLKVAVDVLGGKALGVTADSASVPRRELETATRIAKAVGARHRVIQTEEFDNENYTSNPSNRCFYCKTELYDKLTEVAGEEGVKCIANGSNVDDLGDYRPGLEAAEDFRVVSPLIEAGMNKQDVRDLARRLDLEIWDKPASPCLSSRVPYGSVVSIEKLSAVERAESFLDNLGIRERRVRHFGKKARVEANGEELRRLLAEREKIETHLRSLGFDDIEFAEFRSGALNDALKG